MDTWMGHNHDPVTLHKYLYANVDPVNGIDPTGNFTMASVGAANNVASALMNFQIDTGMNINVELDPSSVGRGPNLMMGLSVLVGAAAFKILRMLSGKFRSACNSFIGTTLVSTAMGLVPIGSLASVAWVCRIGVTPLKMV